jgi:CheY-like chemotaxis protein
LPGTAAQAAAPISTGSDIDLNGFRLKRTDNYCLRNGGEATDECPPNAAGAVLRLVRHPAPLRSFELKVAPKKLTVILPAGPERNAHVEIIMNAGKPIEILLIEDSAGDARLALEAIREIKIYNHLSWVADGEEALAFLRREGEYEQAPRPDLILLDLNLPKKDGREVLAEIKADQDLRRIPVVVLTTSQAEEDIFRAYNLNANCYISKPVDLEQFFKVVRSIKEFWLTIVKLPSQ